MFTLIFVMALGAALNRASGMDPFAPGRNIYYTAPAAGFITMVLTWDALLGVIVCAGALLYRVPGWYALIDMGRNNPDYFEDPEKATARDFLLMIPRQMFYFPPALFAFVGTGSVAVGLWTLAVTGLMGALGYLIGHYLWKYKFIEILPGEMGKPNWWAEVCAGATLGGMTIIGLNYIG